MTLQNAFGNLALDATLAAQKANLDYRYSGGKSSYGAVLSTSGDTAVLTPASGKRIRVFWVSLIPNSDNTVANLVTVKFTSTVLYLGYAIAHWEVFTGSTDEVLTVNLANAQPVAFTVHYQEIT